MVRDPRNLDQNPVVIDPEKVDAVLDDRPTKVSNPLAPAKDSESSEVDSESDESSESHDSGDPRPLSRVVP